MEQWYVWLIIVIVLTVLEITTINLTTIWFVISGILALISSFFIDNYFIQFAIFVIFGVLFLVTTKPLLEKMFQTKKEATNYDRIIGSRGFVTEKITKSQNGEVKVDGKRWSAYADRVIKVGKTVEVLSINGVKVKVKEVEDED